MDIFFQDSDAVPVSPDEVRIQHLEAAPYPDGRKIKLDVTLTPFQQKPSLEIDIYNLDEQKVTSLSVVQAIDAHQEFTLHLREPNPQGEYVVKVQVLYATLIEPEGEDQVGSVESHLVAQGQTTFTIP